MSDSRGGFGIVSLIAVLLAGAWLVVDPATAPAGAALACLSAFAPIAGEWRDLAGTALRPALVWCGIGLALEILAQVVALGQPISGGRPGVGLVHYFGGLGFLAAATTVLNARRPGGQAWALLWACSWSCS